jgi:hypothetical protein
MHVITKCKKVAFSGELSYYVKHLCLKPIKV